MTFKQAVDAITSEMVLRTGRPEDMVVYREYIGQALIIGMEHFNPNQKEVVSMDQRGRETGRYRSVSEAAKKLGICRQSINKVLSGERHTAGGLIFIESKNWKY